MAAAGTGWLLLRSARRGPGPEEAGARAARARVVGGLIVRDRGTRRAIAAGSGVTLPAGAGARIRFEVDTTRYRLDLWRGGVRLATYPVALGGEPVGAKTRQGDHRTPHGTYVLVPHHPSPSFGSCFYVCYPGREDARRGLESALIGQGTFDRIIRALDRGALPPHGTTLGGLILIHGTRNRSLKPLTAANWTDGCIAMENRDLLELLAAFEPADRPTVTIR